MGRVIRGPWGRDDARPVDHGLAEGKSLAFAPATGTAPAGPPIGGLAPAGRARVTVSSGGDPLTIAAATFTAMKHGGPALRDRLAGRFGLWACRRAWKRKPRGTGQDG